MAVEVATAYVPIVPEVKSFGAKLTEGIAAPLADAADTGGKKAGDSFASSFVKKAGVAGVAAGGAIGAGLVGAGVGLFQVGSMFDEAFDKIRVTTGATGSQLAGLQEEFNNAFGDVPASADDVATAISTLNVKLGLTDGPLRGMAEQVLNLSHVTGTDLATNLQSVSDVFNSFGVAAADQPSKLDELFRASQATGISVSDLASSMASAGPNLQQIGFTFEQSAGLLGIFGKAGVDASAIMPTLGKTIAAAAKDGKNAGDVFRDTFNAIKNAPTDTEAAGAAIDVFGAKAGPKLAGLIRQGKLGYQELADTIAAGGDTINGAASDTEDFAEKFDKFKNQTLLTLQPIAEKVFGALGDAMDKIAPKIGPAIDALSSAAGPLVDGLAPAFGTIIGFAGDLVASLGTVDWAGIVAPLIEGIKNIVAVLAGVDWKGVFGIAVSILEPVITAVAKLIGLQWQFLADLLKSIMGTFNDNKDTIKSVADTMGSVLGKAVDVLSAGFGFLSDHIGTVKVALGLLLAGFIVFKAVEGIMATIKIATAAYETLIKGIVIAQKAWNVVQAAFNIIMALNPIVLVVVALAALVAGVILAYQHFAFFHDAVDALWQAIQTAFHWIMDNWPLLLAILTGPIGVAVLLITKNWDTIKDAFTAVKDWIVNAVDVIVGAIVGIWNRVWGAISGFFDAIRTGFSAVKDWIFARVEEIIGFYLSIPGRVIGAILSVFDTLRNGISDVRNNVRDRVEEIIGFLLGIPSRVGNLFGGIFDSLGNAMRSGINSMIGFWNSAPSFDFGGVHGPGGVTIIPGFSVGLPHLNYLAAGGVVTAPTLSVIGERGPEAVLPLSHLFGPQPFGHGDGKGPGDITINAYGTDDNPIDIVRDVRWGMRTAGV